MSALSLHTGVFLAASNSNGAVHRPRYGAPAGPFDITAASYTSRRSLAPNTGSRADAGNCSKTQPPREARSASSVIFTTAIASLSPLSAIVSVTLWHHGHALPT